MILTLLEDWEARFVLRALHILQHVLTLISPDLLVQRGIDLVLHQSLRSTCAYRSGSVHGPSILQTSVSLSLQCLSRARPLHPEDVWFRGVDSLYRRAILDNALFIGYDTNAQLALLVSMEQCITALDLPSIKYEKVCVSLL